MMILGNFSSTMRFRFTKVLNLKLPAIKELLTMERCIGQGSLKDTSGMVVKTNNGSLVIKTICVSCPIDP